MSGFALPYAIELAYHEFAVPVYANTVGLCGYGVSQYGQCTHILCLVIGTIASKESDTRSHNTVDTQQSPVRRRSSMIVRARCAIEEIYVGICGDINHGSSLCVSHVWTVNAVAQEAMGLQ